MNPTSEQMKDEILKQKAQAREIKRRFENAEKAKALADELFLGEKWICVEEGIYLSPRRAVGKKSNYADELRAAQILRDSESTVYLVPESSRQPGKKYDAIVNGLKFEIKTIGGNANTLEHQFLRSRSQAPNVFINLENAILTRREILSALFGARNKPETDKIHGYAYYNKFQGGLIVIKIKNQENLIYLNVNDLQAR